MNPRAFLIRTLVPTVGLSDESEDLGLYAAAAARSWAHFPHMLRVDGLTAAQLKALRERARLQRIPVVEAMPYRHGEFWSEGLVMTADTNAIAILTRDISIDYASVGRALSEMLSALENRTRRLHFRAGDLVLDGLSRIAMMGILNVTPDSFSDGGMYRKADDAVAHAQAMVADGARIIDVGGESTRPGATPVPVAEELDRVVPVIERLRAELPGHVILSVDTMKSEVARAAVSAGAEILNDVSGLVADPLMRRTAAELNVHVIINHMRGTPLTMQQAPTYRHLIPEVIADLSSRVAAALHDGVSTERIIIDPGIGFGKRVADNVSILRHLMAFVSLGHLVAVGVSRKSFLGKLSPDEGASSQARADSTLAAEACAVLSGIHILRTHDPARSMRAVRVAGAVSGHAGGQAAVVE